MSGEGLVERLWHGMPIHALGGWDIEATEELMNEAADALTTAEARVQELEAALSKLTAEVSGLEAAEAGVRAAIGNTNWNVLMLRRDEARTLRGE